MFHITIVQQSYCTVINNKAHKHRNKIRHGQNANLKRQLNCQAHGTDLFTLVECLNVKKEQAVKIAINRYRYRNNRQIKTRFRLEISRCPSVSAYISYLKLLWGKRWMKTRLQKTELWTLACPGGATQLASWRGNHVLKRGGLFGWHVGKSFPAVRHTYTCLYNIEIIYVFIVPNRLNWTCARQCV